MQSILLNTKDAASLFEPETYGLKDNGVPIEPMRRISLKLNMIRRKSCRTKVLGKIPFRADSRLFATFLTAPVSAPA